MKVIISWIKNNPIRTMFLVPIILVALISISHVVTWYSLANPISWAVYLSIAIEIGAMTALVAATKRIQGGVWFMFTLVTLIQMIGNIYFSFKEIDETGELWKSWVELTAPVWEMIGTDLNDTTALKRWLAFLEGGLLPVISLTSLHFFVKYHKREDEEKELLTEDKKKEVTEEENLTNYKEDETEYLLKSEANKEHLEESIKQAEEIIEESEKDLYGESDEVEEEKEEEILKKAMDEYTTKKNENNTKPARKIDTSTGKINTKIPISKNIQRID